MLTFVGYSQNLSYSISATFLNKKPCSYTYNAALGLYASYSLLYNYTGIDPVSYTKILGWRSPYTQLMANSLQEWNQIRKNPTSTGQVFINSIATELETVNDYWKDGRSDMWLSTVPLDSIYRLGRIGLPDHVDLSRSLSKNRLINGGFSCPAVSRFSLPDYWNDKGSYTSGTLSVYSPDSVVGGGSVKASILNGERFYLGQTNKLVYSKGSKLTASIRYKTPIDVSYNKIEPNSKVFLKLKVVADDGITHSFSRELLAATSYRWTSASLTIECPSDVGDIEFCIEGTNSQSYTKEYYFDMAMLEEGSVATSFEPSLLDVPYELKHLNQLYRTPITVEAWEYPTFVTGGLTGYTTTGLEVCRIPVYNIIDRGVFLDDLVPTRIQVNPYVSGIVSSSNTVNGLYVNDCESPRELIWDHNATGVFNYPLGYTDDIHQRFVFADPNTAKVNIRSDVPNNPNELYDRYTIPLIDQHQLGFGYSMVLEDFTIKNNLIWAVCRETYNYSTGRVLKLINTRSEYNTPYLEVVKDFALPNVTTGGGVTSVGFSVQDPSVIVVTLTGAVVSGYLLNTFNDYCYIDPSNRQVFTRQLYSGDTTIVII